VTPVSARRIAAAGALVIVVAAALTGAVGAGPASGPPPTPVNGSRSPFPQVLHTPADPVPRPAIDAAAALLLDTDGDAVLYQRSPSLRRPIASLTKVMTALVVFDRTRPSDVARVDPRAVFARGDYGATSTLGLRPGERMRVADLLAGLLLGSANDAAEALAIHVAGSETRFVALMNRRAAGLGMSDTRFASSSGLDDRGRSTAIDLATLAVAAHGVPAFAQLVATRVRRIEAPSGPDRRIQNRNALLWLYPDAVGTKTGFTAAARYCLVAVAKRDGRTLVAVILGSPHEAFSDAAALLEHGFEGFTRHTFVEAGDDLGVAALEGGDVPVVAGGTLEALVPTAALDDVSGRLRLVPGVAFPPAPGDRVGIYAMSVPGLRIGAVPAVVQHVPPPAGERGPWWVRVGLEVGRAVAGAVGGLAD